MAKDRIRRVRSALEKGFASKGAKVVLFSEKSDYKDFIRMFVISDFFRGKNNKERLGEIFSMLEENGAKDAITKISLCVAMTNREYDREFGKYTWLGRVGDVYHDMKRKPRVARLSGVRGRG
ncbi:MAG: hypothetical protein ACLQMT_13505 [Candidatus Acidiferrales bacterium]